MSLRRKVITSFREGETHSLERGWTTLLRGKLTLSGGNHTFRHPWGSVSPPFITRVEVLESEA